MNPVHIHSNNISDESCNVCINLNRLVNNSLESFSAGQKKSSFKKDEKRGEKKTPIDEIAASREWVIRMEDDSKLIYEDMKNNGIGPDFTMSDVILVSKKLGIDRTIEELGDTIKYLHSLFRRDGLEVSNSHNLLIIRETKEVKSRQQILEIDNIVEKSNYDSLINLSQNQSIYYKDISSTSDMDFDYGSITDGKCINPIFVALFGCKLPALENCVIFGDSFKLLKQFQKKDKPKQENFMLMINRFSEEGAIMFPGISDVLSQEIHRGTLHAQIRALIFRMRHGVFKYDKTYNLEKELLKIVHPDSGHFIPPEEFIMTSILSIFSFRPIIVTVPKISSPMYQCKLQAIPYITFNPTNVISTFDNPIPINSSSLVSLTYDYTKHKVYYNPQMGLKNQMGVNDSMDILSALTGNNILISNNKTNMNPIIVNGTLIYYIERRKSKNVFGLDCNKKITISEKSIDIDHSIIINSLPYKLRSVVCYKVNDRLDKTDCDLNLSSLFTIVFTDKGAWVYDPASFQSKELREQRLIRAMKNKFTEENNGVFDENLFENWNHSNEGETIKNEILARIKLGKSNFTDDIISQATADILISRFSCMLVYSEDYDTYTAAKSISEIFM